MQQIAAGDVGCGDCVGIRMKGGGRPLARQGVAVRDGDYKKGSYLTSWCSGPCENVNHKTT